MSRLGLKEVARCQESSRRFARPVPFVGNIAIIPLVRFRIDLSIERLWYKRIAAVNQSLSLPQALDKFAAVI